MVRNLIPAIYLREGLAFHGFSRPLDEGVSAAGLARHYAENGADALLVLDLSRSDEEHDRNISSLKEICAATEIPVYAGGHIRRLEDVKKILYAGCRMALLSAAKPENIALIRQAAERFGKERIALFLRNAHEYTDAFSEMDNVGELFLFAFSGVELQGLLEVLPDEKNGFLYSEGTCKALQYALDEKESETENEARRSLLSEPRILGLCGTLSGENEGDFFRIKAEAQAAGIPMNVLQSSLSFDAFKTNADGLIPVVVQDFRNDEVLMLAYMNRESFEATLATGFMTYYSRSRKELWRKGETSGHYQYVKSLAIDCDNDTLLAKVAQIGAACHTGNRSCFYRELCCKEKPPVSPLSILERDYAVVADRKKNPKEGSYTNYLLDKGIDKILKKIGEENTEIIIAAKNPDPEEIKYEIADYLYHLTVLMVEKGVTWEEITDELARRQ
ncbi:MAG: bifunctional phosphoribosyl-AMP cyclohydrolase/phosphoribosyl-ATP diphosphatase HisIE [Lachnospiraceae bacterium]